MNLLTPIYQSFSIRLFELTFALKRKLSLYFPHLTQTVYILSFDQVMSLIPIGFH